MSLEDAPVLVDATEEVLVETTAEGTVFREQELPIDISYGKLADWLVDRQKVPKEWRKKLAAIAARVEKLLEKLPREKHSFFLDLSPSSVGYLEARRVRDLLAELYPKERTVFGGLSGLPGEWDTLVRGYERERIFLGEAASVMVANVNYEIPFLRKQISKLQQQVGDSERKESELRRAAAAAGQKYRQACEEMGIEGKNVRHEVRQLVSKLPELFGQAMKSLKSDEVGQALEFYEQFWRFAHGADEKGGEPTGAESDKRLLPTLHELRCLPLDESSTAAEVEVEAGAVEATEVVDAADGVAAGREDALQMQVEADGENDDDDLKKMLAVMGGGVGGAGGGGESQGRGERDERNDASQVSGPSGQEPNEDAAPIEINWDFSVDEGAEGEGTDAGANDVVPAGIQWDIGDLGTAGSGGGDGEEGVERGGGGGGGGGVVEIDWGIDLGEEGANGSMPAGIDWDVGDLVVVEEDGVGHGEGVEKAPRVESSLADAECRNRLLDDLFELHAFLQIRSRELDASDHFSIQQQLMVMAPPSLQQQSASSLRQLDSAVDDVIRILTNRRTRDLILILNSPRYVERLVESMEQKRRSEHRFEENIRELEEKRRDFRNSLTATWPKLEEVVLRTKQIKKAAEEAISKLYDRRPVNIIGEINNALNL